MIYIKGWTNKIQYNGVVYDDLYDLEDKVDLSLEVKPLVIHEIKVLVLKE